MQGQPGLPGKLPIKWCHLVCECDVNYP